MHRAAAAAALVGSGAALAACDAGGDANARPVATAAGPVSLVMHSRTTDADHYSERASAFHAANPNVDVTIESTAGNEYNTKVTALQASNTLGDAMWHTQTMIFVPFAATGGLRPLDDLVKRDKYDLGQFFPNTIEQLRWKGKLYGLPWLVHTGFSGIMVNEDVWQRVGQPVPAFDWTFQREFLDALQKVGRGVAADGADRFAMDMPYTLQGAITYVRSWGAEFLSDDGKKSLLNNSKAVEALTFAHDLVNVYRVVPRPDQSVANMFATGRTASSNGAYFQMANLRVQTSGTFKWRAYPMPKGPGGLRNSFLGLDDTSITATSKHPDAAWLWTRFLATKETGLLVARDRGSPGGRPDVWDDPSLAADPSHQMFKEWMKIVKPLPMPANSRVLDMFSTLATGLSALYTQKTSAPAAIADLHQQLQNVLDS
jgi:multiple sugar transport system substrate-binding protein